MSFRFADLRLATKIVVCCLVPVVLAVALSIAAWRSIESLIETNRVTEHTHWVLDKGAEIFEDALNMETGQRGYLLTGNEEFLETFKKGEQEVAQDFAELKKRMAHSPEQVELLGQAEAVLNDWRNRVALPEIELRREIGEAKDVNDLAKVVQEGKGNEYFDRIRAHVKLFTNKQRAALSGQSNEKAGETDVQKLRETIRALESRQRIDRDMDEIMLAIGDMEAGARGFLLTANERAIEPLNSGKQRFLTLMSNQKKAVSDSPEQVKLLEKIEGIVRDWLSTTVEPEIALRRKIAASKTMADLAAVLRKGESKRIFDRFRSLLDTFDQRERGFMQQREKAAAENAAMVRTVLLLGTILIAGISLCISYPLARSITRPLKQAIAVAEAASKGDLTGTVTTASKDEVGQLSTSVINVMVGTLREQMKTTLEGVAVLAESTKKIKEVVSRVSAATSETASAITEVVSTVHQLGQTARVSTERAQDVAETARRAVHVTAEGMKATDETAKKIALIKEQMQSIGENVVRLSEQSQTIESIINAVQDVADQSNLLAVNASIEAARAREQGKGFAVVAQEIKTLADQSRESTVQVRSILGETRKWVSTVVMSTEQGAKAVQVGLEQSLKAGDSIENLSKGVTESAQAASVIEASMQQQLAGTSQVSESIMNIDRAMKHNMDRMAELEEEVEKLQRLGNSFDEFVRQFRV